MDLTKLNLVVRTGMTGTDSPIYLLLKGSSRVLIQLPALLKKRKDLATLLKEADPPVDTGVVIVRNKTYPLTKGGFKATVKRKPVVRPVPKGATRVFRVHPGRLSQKQREKICPPGLGGEARRQFVEEGITFSEQVHRAKESNAIRQGEFAKKERARKRERRKSNKARPDFETPGGDDSPEPRFEGVGVKEIAQQAGLEPTEVRRFLRAKKIGKRGGRYAFTDKEAKKVIRAVKKHYREEG